MARNGFTRINAPTHKIPSVGLPMRQGGFIQGDPGKFPTINEVVRQGKGRQGGGDMPSIGKVVRQGGKTIKTRYY